MKKVISLIVAVMMIMALIATPAFAAGTGSITIDNAIDGNVYSIYKILDLESYNSAGAYSYKVNAAWTAFFATPEALNYVSIDDAGYVTWKTTDDDATVAAFAKLALKFAQDNGIAAIKSAKTLAEFDSLSGTSATFTGLELGYYLVDSSMGALCGLTTTAPNATITAKNAAPVVLKQVQEDSLSTEDGRTGGWESANTADIGQTVYYMVTVNVHAGAQNYVYHDKMDAGLTFGEVTLVNHIIPGTGTNSAAGKYTVNTSCTDGCTFEIVLNQDFCDELVVNDKIVIYYTATLNKDAVIAGEGNKNSAWLTFGDHPDPSVEHTSNVSTVTTITHAADIVKTTSTNQLLDGAKFKLYDALTGGNEIPVVWDAANNVYRRAITSGALADDPADYTDIDISVDGGMARVEGLDNGKYYLEETVAPEGYNKLNIRSEFIIADANLDASVSGGAYLHSGVQVINKTGSVLPTTGGIGTTLFVTLGGLAVLAAGVVLFAKKRMSQIAE